MAVNSATATFTGASDTVSVTYTPTSSVSPTVLASDPVMTNSTDPMAIVVIAGVPTRTTCTVKASYAFVGSVNLVILD